MLDNNYLKAADIIERAKSELEKIFEVADSKGLENNQAYYQLENIIDRLESSFDKFNYLAADTKQGTLLENSTGKFYVAYDDGEESYPLSCGNSLELFYDDEWHLGRVEAHSGGIYYFYGDEKPLLTPGMRARKRIV